MTERLKIVIEDLYRTFSRYNATDMTGSDLWKDQLPIWNKEILSKPLRELSQEDLVIYAGKAMTTWGSAKDYKHFLPRILELTAALNSPLGIDNVLGKLEMTDWNNWPPHERSLIHEYMVALWENIINDNSQSVENEFKEYMSFLFEHYPNVSHLLKIWETAESKASIKHLANYIVEYSQLLFRDKGIFGNGKAYTKPPEELDKLNKLKIWLLSDKVLEKLQRKYFKYETEDFAEKISWAEKIIDSERQNFRYKRV